MRYGGASFSTRNRTTIEAREEANKWRQKYELVSTARERLVQKYKALQAQLSEARAVNQRLQSQGVDVQQTVDTVNAAYKQALTEKEKFIKYLQEEISRKNNSTPCQSRSGAEDPNYTAELDCIKTGNCQHLSEKDSPDSTSHENARSRKGNKTERGIVTDTSIAERSSKLRLVKGRQKRNRYSEETSPENAGKRQKKNLSEMSESFNDVEKNFKMETGFESSGNSVEKSTRRLGHGNSRILVVDTCDPGLDTTVNTDHDENHSIPGTPDKRRNRETNQMNRTLACKSFSKGINSGDSDLYKGGNCDEKPVVSVPETLFVETDSYIDEEDNEHGLENQSTAEVSRIQPGNFTPSRGIKMGQQASDDDGDEEEETVKEKSPVPCRIRSLLNSPLSDDVSSDHSVSISNMISHKTLDLSSDGCVLDSSSENGNAFCSQTVLNTGEQNRNASNTSKESDETFKADRNACKMRTAELNDSKFSQNKRLTRKRQEEEKMSNSQILSCKSRNLYKNKSDSGITVLTALETEDPDMTVDPSSLDLDMTVSPHSAISLGIKSVLKNNGEVVEDRRNIGHNGSNLIVPGTPRSKNVGIVSSTPVLSDVESPSLLNGNLNTRGKSCKISTKAYEDVVCISSHSSDPNSPLLLQTRKSRRSRLKSARTEKTQKNCRMLVRDSVKVKVEKSRSKSLNLEGVKTKKSGNGSFDSNCKEKLMITSDLSKEKTQEFPPKLCQATLTQTFFSGPKGRSRSQDKEEADLEKAIRLSLEDASLPYLEETEKENSPPFKKPHIPYPTLKNKIVVQNTKETTDINNDIDLDETTAPNVEVLSSSRNQTHILKDIGSLEGHRPEFKVVQGEGQEELRLNGSIDPAANLTSWCDDSEAMDNELMKRESDETLPSLEQDFQFETLHKGDNSIQRTSTLAVEDSQEIPSSSHSHKFVARKKQRKKTILEPPVVHPSLNDSFDVVPKKADTSYAHVAVVRKRDERQKIQGYSCTECYNYYKSKGLSEAEIQKQIQECSRHRAKHLPPDTPPHFWSIGFLDTQECQDRGYIEVEEKSEAGPSKFRRKRRLMKHFRSKHETTTLASNHDNGNVSDSPDDDMVFW